MEYQRCTPTESKTENKVIACYKFDLATYVAKFDLATYGNECLINVCKSDKDLS
jgi:hypothetical protein